VIFCAPTRPTRESLFYQKLMDHVGKEYETVMKMIAWHLQLPSYISMS